jgi:hypothetical protein
MGLPLEMSPMNTFPEFEFLLDVVGDHEFLSRPLQS